MEVRAGHLHLRSKYFAQQLTCAEYDGDGTDRQIWNYQPDFLMYCSGSTQFLDEDKDQNRIYFQRAVAEGRMNADGDVNPDWEREKVQDEEEETQLDEDADVDMEDAGDGEGGEEVQQDETPEETSVAFSNLCLRPAAHGTH